MGDPPVSKPKQYVYLLRRDRGKEYIERHLEWYKCKYLYPRPETLRHIDYQYINEEGGVASNEVYTLWSHGRLLDDFLPSQLPVFEINGGEEK